MDTGLTSLSSCWQKFFIKRMLILDMQIIFLPVRAASHEAIPLVDEGAEVTPHYSLLALSECRAVAVDTC